MLLISQDESACAMMAQAITWLGSLSVPMNILLFIIRADAVFLRNTRCRIIFGFLWLMTLTSLMAPFSITGTSIPMIHKCSVEKANSVAGAGIAIVGVVDTILFLAITVRVVNWYNLEQRGLFARCGRVSRNLLLTGQLYYLYVCFFCEILTT